MEQALCLFLDLKRHEGDGKMQMKTSDDKSLPSCNVSTTFNSAVGVLAVIAAVAIAYLAYRYW
jgi:hypothetical protein